MKSRHTLPLALLMLVVGAITAAVIFLIDWYPDQAAEQAERVDALMWFLVISSGVIFTIVTTFLVYSIWRFRAAPGDETDGPPNHGNTKLEIAWTILPVVLLAVMAVWATIVIDRNEALAADREIIEVKAWQFTWEFYYGEGESTVASGDLILPVDRQVQLEMRSPDVIHNLYVPEFRVKQDVVPGITTRLVINPTREGEYDLICSELCGVGHSVMRARAIVVSQAEYRAWLANARREVAAQTAPRAGAPGAGTGTPTLEGGPDTPPATATTP